MKFGSLHFVISGLRLESEHGMLPQIQFSPVPQHIEYGEGLLSFQKNIKIFTNLDNSLSFIWEDFESQLSDIISKSFKISVNDDDEFISNSDEYENTIKNLSHMNLDNLQTEGYILHIESSKQQISIEAENPRGIFYALQTLYQILACNKPDEFYLQSIKVLDYPNMKIRGLSDDVSRGQAATKDGLKQYIHELAKFKLNYYFLYVEDVIRLSKHLNIGLNRGAYDAKTIREVSDYAKRHFIELSLVFESLGHMDNILSLPEYHQYAEFPSSDCLNVADERIYDLIEEIYEELFELFDAESFHVGCDESWELGQYRSREYVKKVGKAETYRRHYNKIYEIAKQVGFKHIFIYHDIAIKFKDVLENIPDDYIFVFWKYSNKEKYPDLDKLVNKGFKTVVSPAVQDWNRFFPDMTAMEGNTENIIRYGYERGSIGVIQSSWGDFRNEQLRQRIYGFAFSSCTAWNVEKFDRKTFWDVFIRNYFGIRKPEDITALNGIYHVFSRFFTEKLLGGKENYPRLWAPPYGYPGKKWYTKGYNEILPEIELLVTKTESILELSSRKTLDIEKLNFCARLYRIFAKKMIVSSQIANEKITVSGVDLVWLRKEFGKLKEMYERLWSAECAVDNLKPILDNYDAMITLLDLKIQQLNGKKAAHNPNIPSKWIYYCKKKHRGYALESFFRKELVIEKPIDYAKIQIIGDTHVRVYLNGEKIDEFFSKRTLSVRMLNNMVKIIDLTPKINKGANSLVIENINYQGGYGIVNLFGEIQYTDGNVEEIVSDESWEATNVYNDLWIDGTEEFLPNTSSNAHAKELAGPPFVNGALTYPDFVNDIKSHHTSHLGLGSEALRYIPLFLQFLLKFISKNMYKHGAVL